MDGRQNRGTDKEVISGWMVFFLSCLEILIAKLETKYASYKERGHYTNKRQQQIIQYIEAISLQAQTVSSFLRKQPQPCHPLL